MDRIKLGYVLVLTGGILSLIYGVTLIVINVIAKALSPKIAIGEMPVYGMSVAEQIATMFAYNPLAIIGGIIVIIFSIFLIISSKWIKKPESHKKGVLIAIVLGIIGLILSLIWQPLAFSSLLPITVLIGAYIITIIGGIIGYK